MSKNQLDLCLVLITLLFLGCVVLANEDPVARLALFGKKIPEDGHVKTIFKALYDIGIGGLVSIVFYFLLVRLPDNARRQRVRRHLEKQLVTFKKDCIYIILGVVNGYVNLELVDTLVEQNELRTYFSTFVEPSEDRWHVFLNRIDQNNLNEILRALNLLREEVNFATGAIDINTDEAFDFMKRFSAVIHDIQRTELDYDSIKRLDRFLWSILSGWDPIYGYKKHNIVSRMIRSI
jgi:hypothetical protein